MMPIRVDELGHDECLLLLDQVPVGRVAVTVGTLPDIFPVNFATLDGSLIIRTVPGTELSAATANSLIAFETDSYDSDGRSGWSFVVQGIASEMVDPGSVAASLIVLGSPWGVAESADRFVKIEVQMMSGRRFRGGFA